MGNLNLVFERRKDAVEMLGRMQNLLDAFGWVSKADCFELMGVETRSYHDDDYGWSDLEDAVIKRIPESHFRWVLTLPPMVEYSEECCCECPCECEQVEYEMNVVDAFEALKVFEQHGVPIDKATEILADLVSILYECEEV